MSTATNHRHICLQQQTIEVYVYSNNHIHMCMVVAVCNKHTAFLYGIKCHQPTVNEANQVTCMISSYYGKFSKALLLALFFHTDL